MSNASASRGATVRADLRNSTLDGVLYSLMVGVGETYLPAFVLASGKGELASGLVATLPMLAGAVLQIVTPHAVARLGSHRRWVVLCTSFQALCFVPLAVGAWVGTLPTAAIFLCAALYWAAGLGAAPAWNTWITTTVPHSIRAPYFALRTRACHAAALVGLLAGGFALQLGTSESSPVRSFAALFALAGAARWLSSRRLAAQSEPKPLPPGFRALRWREITTSPSLRRGRSLILYLFVVQSSVQVAAPFYSPYMLGSLRLGYATYMTLIATAFVAKMVALPYLGRIARRVGAQRLAWIGGVGIVPAAVPWCLTDAVPILLGAQLIAGTFWAAYELGTFLMLFETIEEHERTSVMTIFNLVNASAFALGSMAGGALLGSAPDAAAYVTLFVVSSALRALSLLFLRRVERAADPVELPLTELIASAVRPSMGSIDRPLLSDSGADPGPRDPFATS